MPMVITMLDVWRLILAWFDRTVTGGRHMAEIWRASMLTPSHLAPPSISPPPHGCAQSLLLQITYNIFVRAHSNSNTTHLGDAHCSFQIAFSVSRLLKEQKKKKKTVCGAPHDDRSSTGRRERMCAQYFVVFRLRIEMLYVTYVCILQYVYVYIHI